MLFLLKLETPKAGEAHHCPLKETVRGNKWQEARNETSTKTVIKIALERRWKESYVVFSDKWCLVMGNFMACSLEE